MSKGFEIIHPTLLLDKERCLLNIDRMCTKMLQSDIQFRPHFKTHQSLLIGNWFREYQVEKITVSSLRMAQYFAADGWTDITVAFPVNLREASLINALAERIQLNLLAEDPDVIQQLDQVLTHRVGLFLKIDVGTHRTGLDPQDLRSIESCVKVIANSDRIMWMGFLAHAGHTYQVRQDISQVENIYAEAIEHLAQLKAHFTARFPDILISFGDTPGASMLTDFNGIDEMRPGNFVFYDLMQTQIGSCSTNEIAVMMVCPVVAVHAKRHEYIIYGGGIHFSKEHIQSEDGRVSYGGVVPFAGSGQTVRHETGFIRSLSQEHGVIRMLADQNTRFRPGDLMAVLPVHSCMTAQCMGAYRTLDGSWIDHFGSSKFSHG